MAAGKEVNVVDLGAGGSVACKSAVELLRRGLPDLDNGSGYDTAWGALAVALARQPLFGKDDIQGLERAGHVLLKFGEDVFAEETGAATPLERPRRAGDPPLNSRFDYLALAVARQVALLLPEWVSEVQMMEQLYGGRLITDIIPEAGEHVDFQGATKRVDHSRDAVHAMHLHCDDADHVMRPPIQLLCGVKNLGNVATTLAVVPPDGALRAAGCDPDVLRQPRYKHCPPGQICTWNMEEVPPRPVLFGPADMPRVQADAKGLVPLDEEADAAWRKLSCFLLQQQIEVVVGAGDVLLIDNYRGLHGRAEIQPVGDLADRRWVKRLWLSPRSAEAELAACASARRGHRRVFDRNKVIRAGLGMLHPPLANSEDGARQRRYGELEHEEGDLQAPRAEEELCR